MGRGSTENKIDLIRAEQSLEATLHSFGEAINEGNAGLLRFVRRTMNDEDFGYECEIFDKILKGE